MPLTRLLILLSAAALTLAGNSASIPAKPAVKPVSRVSNAAVQDAVIEQSIRQRFAKSKISTNKFTVRVQGGTAYLDGKTDVIQHKGTATRLAKSGGAKQVVNKIEISERAREKASANLEKAGGERRSSAVKLPIGEEAGPAQAPA